MSYFYADGVDRNGNRLVTSYKKADQAKRFRAGATVTQGLKYLELQEDGGAKLATEGELLLRTLMISSGETEKMEGNFVVWARINNRWQATDFRYSTYAKANAAVKGALIGLYGMCAVIEESEGTDASDTGVPVSTAEDAVF